jgi:hypothetical protein
MWHCYSRYLYQVCALDLDTMNSNCKTRSYSLMSKLSTGTVCLPRHAASAIDICQCLIMSRNMTFRHPASHIENDARPTKSNISVSHGRSQHVGAHQPKQCGKRTSTSKESHTQGLFVKSLRRFVSLVS